MILDRILFQASELVPSKNLVFMGGCALNCSANRITNRYFDKTWIMPNPGDAGSAIGTVLAHNPQWRIDPKDFTPYIGYDMGVVKSNHDIVEYLLTNQICGIAKRSCRVWPKSLR